MVFHTHYRMLARTDEGITAAHIGGWKMAVRADKWRSACLDTQAGCVCGHYFDERGTETGTHRHILALQYDQTSHIGMQTGGQKWSRILKHRTWKRSRNLKNYEQNGRE